MVPVWVLPNARGEIERTPYAAEIWRILLALGETRRVPPGWHHAETEAFAALGPPGTSVRVYYARHAGQYVVLLAASGKRGRGKLERQRRRTVEARLDAWRSAYPNGLQP